MALPSRFCYNVKIINRLIISVALTRDILDTYRPLGVQRHHSRVSIEESLLFRFPFICVDTVVEEVLNLVWEDIERQLRNLQAGSNLLKMHQAIWSKLLY